MDAAPTGSTDGEATLEIGGGSLTGHGTLHLTDAAWQPAGLPRHLPIAADRATLDWHLATDRLHVDHLELGNRELTATAEGVVTLAPVARDAGLDLMLRIVPQPGMPQAHLDGLRSLPGSAPDRDGGRRFRLAGTLGTPYLARP